MALSAGGHRGRGGGNAGIVVRHPILESPLAAWERMVRTTFSACVHCARLAGQHIIARGGGGAIIGIASIHVQVAKAGVGPYGATKAAIDMLNKQLAVELAPHGIANVVAAGTIATDINIPRYRGTHPADVATREAVLKRAAGAHR